MSRIILHTSGKIESRISGNTDMINLNTGSDVLFIDNTEPNSPTDYWDFDLHQFISIGDAPSPHHVFDYSFKQWIDPRTLDEIKAQKWAEIKSERDRIEFGGFDFEGNIYDSDQVSQGRILGAASAGLSQVWTLADNSTRSLSASQLQQLYAALQTHTALVHERGRIAREAIMSATTKEDVEAVTL